MLPIILLLTDESVSRHAFVHETGQTNVLMGPASLEMVRQSFLSTVQKGYEC
jgi:hypothetical protein